MKSHKAVTPELVKITHPSTKIRSIKLLSRRDLWSNNLDRMSVVVRVK